MEEGTREIEEKSVRLGGGSESRWVDGSEVDSESTPTWSLLEEDERSVGGESVGLRRRLKKKPKRVDSFDVEALGISDAHSNHAKVFSPLKLFDVQIFS